VCGVCGCGELGWSWWFIWRIIDQPLTCFFVENFFLGGNLIFGWKLYFWWKLIFGFCDTLFGHCSFGHCGESFVLVFSSALFRNGPWGKETILVAGAGGGGGSRNGCPGGGFVGGYVTCVVCYMWYL